MLLRRKQTPPADEQLIPPAWTLQTTEREAGGRSKSGTPRVAKFSRLSAQMVELSLEQAQRERTLRGASPNNPSTVSSPLLWPTDIQNIARSTTESVEEPGTEWESALAAANPVNPPQAQATPRQLRIPNFAVLYSQATVILRGMANYWNEVPPTLVSWLGRLRVNGSAAFGNLRGCWKSVQNDERLAAVGAGILCRLTIASQRTQLIYQPAAILIGRWSRWTATITQLLAERVSAKLIMVSRSQPLRHLKHACEKNIRVLTARPPVVWAVIRKFVAHRGSRFVVLRRRDTGRGHRNHK